MKRILLIIFIILVLTGGGYFYYINFLKPKVVHYHAGFQVYVDGKLQDFSDLKYMNVEPCTTHSENSHEDEDEQIEKAHLHDFVGDVVHVHRSNSVWGDLFQNIKFRIDDSKTITSYVNGKKADDVLNKPIHAYDSLILLIGKHGEVNTYLKKAVTKEHIVKTEKKSESCGGSS